MAALYGYLGRDTGALIQECRALAEGLEAFWDEENGAYASFLRDNQRLQYAELIPGAGAVHQGLSGAEKGPSCGRGALQRPLAGCNIEPQYFQITRRCWRNLIFMERRYLTRLRKGGKHAVFRSDSLLGNGSGAGSL